MVNGDDVTATGLFVEHFQQRNLVWEGNGGTVVLFQNELPYDPPTQADWTQPDGTLGYPGLHRGGERPHAPAVRRRACTCSTRTTPSIVTATGFSVPDRPGVRLHHVMTVNLGAGLIEHVVNDTGAPVDTSTTGTPSFVIDYP